MIRSGYRQPLADLTEQTMRFNETSEHCICSSERVIYGRTVDLQEFIGRAVLAKRSAIVPEFVMYSFMISEHVFCASTNARATSFKWSASKSTRTLEPASGLLTNMVGII